MRLEQNQHELILRDEPGCLWMFGLFFVAVGGLFVYGGLGGFQNKDEVPAWTLALAALMGAIGVATGVWFIWRHPRLTTRVNRLTQTVSVEKFGIGGRKIESYGFARTREFQVYEDSDDEGSPIYEIVLRLTDGAHVELSNTAARNRAELEVAVKQLNDFTFGNS